MHISIIIPSRDRRETLRRTLAALAGQRLEAATAELLLVDDGSRDGTADAVEAMVPDYPLALRVLRARRARAGSAATSGCEAAAGEVVLFRDDTAPAARGPARRACGAACRGAGAGLGSSGVGLGPGPRPHAVDAMARACTVSSHSRRSRPGLRRPSTSTPRTCRPSAPSCSRPAASTSACRSCSRTPTSVPGSRPPGSSSTTARSSWSTTITRSRSLGGSNARSAPGRAGHRLRELRRDVDPRVVPDPEGWRWVAARGLARVTGAPASEWRGLPAPLRDRLYSTAHAAAYARGYRAAPKGSQAARPPRIDGAAALAQGTPERPARGHDRGSRSHGRPLRAVRAARAGPLDRHRALPAARRRHRRPPAPRNVGPRHPRRDLRARALRRARAGRAALAQAREPLRVLDLGAHVGLFGTWALREWPGARVTAVEADPANAAQLRRTIELAGPGAALDAVAGGGRRERRAGPLPGRRLRRVAPRR